MHLEAVYGIPYAASASPSVQVNQGYPYPDYESFFTIQIRLDGLSLLRLKYIHLELQNEEVNMRRDLHSE